MADLPKSHSERRKDYRLENNIPVKIFSDEADVLTETLNLSCSGAYCRVNKCFQPMTKLKILLLLPFKKRGKAATQKITCEGVIVRTEADADKEHFRIAIFFNEIQKKDAALISEYIASVLEQRNQSNAQPQEA